MIQPERLLRNIILTFVVLIALKFSIGNSALFKSDKYTGMAYSIKIPQGWIMKRNEGDPGLFMTNYNSMGKILFETPEKRPDTDISVATITIIEAKLKTPAWLDDIFPEVLQSLSQMRAKIKQKGEIKMDGQIAKWVLYKARKSKDLNLEFYVADEKTGMFKMVYSSDPAGFMKYRKSFEAVRDSFLFSRALW